MDPRATLNRICDALHDELIDEAVDAARDYLEWREKGGFDAKPDSMMTSDAWVTLCSLLVDANNIIETKGKS